MTLQTTRIPVNVVFGPGWWFHRYGIPFTEDFYLHPARRIENDVIMRRALWQRFGIGSADDAPRPVMGCPHIAGGFVMPALFGNTIRFCEDQAAWPMVREMSRSEILNLRVPDVRTTWPMNVLIEQMESLKAEFGYVTGDLNTGGLINTALELRGQQFFLDMAEDPELADHLLDVIGRTQVEVATCVKSYTGTCGVATNVSVLSCDAGLYLHSNCSVQMISPALYERRLLVHEQRVADSMRPYGIHHCGHNLHLFASRYRTLAPAYVDVGWGSDVRKVAKALPDTFLNLRMSPVRMLQQKPEDIHDDVMTALLAAGRRDRVGVCCINMDGDTPDENVKAMFQATADFECEVV